MTFSCYNRRRLLDEDRAKRIVIHFLASRLTNQQEECPGFVIMPDHVHALPWFGQTGRLSVFMNQWKRRSSMNLKRFYREWAPVYGGVIDLEGRMWQPKYYCFNVYSEIKLREKLGYMHNNPVMQVSSNIHRTGSIVQPDDIFRANPLD